MDQIWQAIAKAMASSSVKASTRQNSFLGCISGGPVIKQNLTLITNLSYLLNLTYVLTNY
jgi:hypothetical protein